MSVDVCLCPLNVKTVNQIRQPNAVKARRSFNFFLNYCKTLRHVMQLTKGSSHYNNGINKPANMADIKTTEINTETQELILKYYKLPDQHLKTAYYPS